MSDTGWVETRLASWRGVWLAAALAALGGVVDVSSGVAAPPAGEQGLRVRPLSRPRQPVPVRQVALQAKGVSDLPANGLLPPARVAVLAAVV